MDTFTTVPSATDSFTHGHLNLFQNPTQKNQQKIQLSYCAVSPLPALLPLAESSSRPHVLLIEFSFPGRRVENF